MVNALESMPGIRQVIETEELREVFAVALLRTEEEEDDLRARILEHAHGRAVMVKAIRTESHEPTVLGGCRWLRRKPKHCNERSRKPNAEDDCVRQAGPSQ